MYSTPSETGSLQVARAQRRDWRSKRGSNVDQGIWLDGDHDYGEDSDDSLEARALAWCVPVPGCREPIKTGRFDSRVADECQVRQQWNIKVDGGGGEVESDADHVPQQRRGQLGVEKDDDRLDRAKADDKGTAPRARGVSLNL